MIDHAHVALSSDPWRESEVSAAIDEIVADGLEGARVLRIVGSSPLIYSGTAGATASLRSIGRCVRAARSPLGAAVRIRWRTDETPT